MMVYVSPAAHQIQSPKAAKLCVDLKLRRKFVNRSKGKSKILRAEIARVAADQIRVARVIYAD